MNTILRYAVAVACPPAGLYLAGHPVKASVAGLLFGFALWTIGEGTGAVILFFLIAWAVKAVAERKAREEVRHFIKGMNGRPIEVLRRKPNAA